MEVPLEITFRDVAKNDDLDRLIRAKAAGLEKICEDIIGCRVAVESPHAHQQSGNPFRVRISLRVPPGRELYFHRNSVLNDDFDRLEIGTGVRFVPGAGDEGPKATTVQIVDKPGANGSESD